MARRVRALGDEHPRGLVHAEVGHRAVTIAVTVMKATCPRSVGSSARARSSTATKYPVLPTPGRRAAARRSMPVGRALGAPASGATRGTSLSAPQTPARRCRLPDCRRLAREPSSQRPACWPISRPPSRTPIGANEVVRRALQTIAGRAPTTKSLPSMRLESLPTSTNSPARGARDAVGRERVRARTAAGVAPLDVDAGAHVAMRLRAMSDAFVECSR